MPESHVRKADNHKRSASPSKAQGAEVKHAVSRRLTPEETPRRRRWLLPAMIVLAALGVAWGVVYFSKSDLIGFAQGLGQLNVAIGAAAVVLAAILYLALRPRSGTPYAPGSRRWVPPTFIAVGVFGVLWLIVYYVAGQDLAFMALLGNWNILIGMGGMAAAFVVATLWK